MRGEPGWGLPGWGLPGWLGGAGGAVIWESLESPAPEGSPGLAAPGAAGALQPLGAPAFGLSFPLLQVLPIAEVHSPRFFSSEGDLVTS